MARDMAFGDSIQVQVLDVDEKAWDLIDQRSDLMMNLLGKLADLAGGHPGAAQMHEQLHPVWHRMIGEAYASNDPEVLGSEDLLGEVEQAEALISRLTGE